MAALDQPSGLMEIASSLTQDEIPFKLRCAICNKLAVNAFRLPCCDQAICESCQASLPDTCPVCAHTPLSADLCKPNKALRTTLKAFLRTEEKKREKERQSATPAVANGTTPLEGTPTQPDAPAPPSVPEEKAPEEQTQPASVADGRSEQPLVEATAAEPQPHDAELGLEAPEGAPARDAHSEALPADAADQAGSAPQDHSGEGDGNEDNSVQPVEQEVPDQTQNPMASNGMGFNMGPGFPNMAWNNAGGFNPMSQPFMGGGMFNFPNAMGMPGMAMDPMAANPGMMGGYGMNMNGMNNGMNMGMSYDAGQGMYGGWDGSQNSMWNGQDKINPNGFATGMGAQYGPSGFGGYNMSQPNGVHAQMHHQQFPPQDFQPGFNGQGYGRGNFRGRGRGFFAGRGRGGFPGSLQANYSYQSHNSPSFNADMASQSHDGISPDVASGDAAMADAKEAEGAGEHVPGSEQDPQQIASSGDVSSGPDGNVAESVPVDVSGDATQMEGDTSQLRGIPTIDSLDEANAQAMGGPMGMNAPMGPGYGRGGYMRGSFPGRGGYGGPFMPQHNMQSPRVVPGVEGAPAAPRAMRQGLPNTSVLRQRPFQGPGRSPISRPAASQSATPTAQDDQQPQLEPRSRSASRGRSPSKPRSRSRSPSYHDRPYRQRSASADRQTDDSERRRERRRREDRREDQPAPDDRRTRSPSVDSRQSTYRRDRGRDRRIDRRSRRHRSPSASRNGDSRDDRLSLIAEEKGTGSRSRTPVTADAESSSRRSGRDRPSRREEDREREKDSRRRDRDRNHERERDRDRDRDRYRERERDRDRERERERERDRDRDRRRARDKERDRDRKRSRRDRSASPADSEYSSRHHSRRVKRSRDDDARPSDRERTKDKPSKTTEPEKDPHTLEREARNRERLLKEQQRREAMHADGGGGGGKSSRRRDSRQDRGLTGGRRLGYKYEDEENDDARAARVESEREASRWA